MLVSLFPLVCTPWLEAGSRSGGWCHTTELVLLPLAITVFTMELVSVLPSVSRDTLAGSCCPCPGQKRGWGLS